jgi:outer membrane protein OmpA-like peptidoglycan-associated protein
LFWEGFSQAGCLLWLGPGGDPWTRRDASFQFFQLMKYSFFFVAILACVVCAAQRTDTFDVYFERNDAVVNANAKEKINKLISAHGVRPGQQLMLLGYADYLGAAAHNDSLSMARADNVKRYLLSRGFHEDDISLCAGRGSVERVAAGGQGHSADRKVLIITNVKTQQKTSFRMDIEMVKVKGNGLNYAIGKYHITQAQWAAVMGDRPAEFKGCDSCPIEHVSIGRIQAFLRKLDSLTGIAYRLPTNAEWQYAAGGGSKGHDYLFSGSKDLDEVGWYAGNSNGRTHPVGQKKPNELGIYDMAGNVWQWCAESSGTASHPLTIRGGAYFLSPRYCSYKHRCLEVPVEGNGAVGFRVAYSL